MVELRKRKAPAQAPAAERKAKKVQESTVSRKPDVSKAISDDKAPKVGDKLDLDNFGGEFETDEGQKTTLKDLVDASEAGVVLFTYPRASTPGCTKQACLFRDNYDSITESGLSIYGLSADSPKANTTFKTKQRLPYPLLCNPTATLIAALGLKKSPKGTIRGIFAIDKHGKVLILQAGGPDATLDAARNLAAELKRSSEDETSNASPPAKDD
ncbi:thioredoxin peroxidase DOT5 [Aspergillus vadensis CBS 113365]|uniref:thioredoxin-dependent peroxiredoxin n=1 Tax=Aspergillus vadensis (strain CBS 113365 / IMI 142717 / IBT 24658) TaxID=1448311 RepID=A0A319C6J4_ASPVC|nr:AhpC-TSA-domain-containing protein [Aspergillus vadensis CBS 113365]PYH74023.1 AhpC-TSA-domain-containing protein [Aspergillus vadensis CBS 113365]